MPAIWGVSEPLKSYYTNLKLINYMEATDMKIFHFVSFIRVSKRQRKYSRFRDYIVAYAKAKKGRFVLTCRDSKHL